MQYAPSIFFRGKSNGTLVPDFTPPLSFYFFLIPSRILKNIKNVNNKNLIFCLFNNYESINLKFEFFNNHIVWFNGFNNLSYIWREDCDFRNGNIYDLVTVDSSKENCGFNCLMLNGCTHFSWGWNGKCVLKKASYSENFTYQKDVTCGKMTAIPNFGKIVLLTMTLYFFMQLLVKIIFNLSNLT